MKFRIIGLCCWVACLASTPTGAQDAVQQAMDRVSLRVTLNKQQGHVVVDRGKSDRIAAGDRASFHPRGGRVVDGVVVRVGDRSAVVELDDKTVTLPLGTRGEIEVPKSRGAPGAGVQRPKPQQQVKTPPGKGEGGEKPTFKNKDDGYKKGMPLLRQMKPMRPHQREMQMSGRVYMIGELTSDFDSEYSHSFGRAGIDVLYENPFGRGGGVRANAEVNVRTEQTEEEGADLFVRRLSYYTGGTRFDDTHFEIGRFVQTGMPEFQVLDGIEWGRRTEKGNRYGWSLGFLPEPDDDFESMEDLQLAGYYQWVWGEREELRITAGAQKTAHNGHLDRDLLVAKVNYLPLDGWDFHSTLWVDYFYGRDEIKGHGFEVTRAMASLGRRWKSGNGVDISIRRIRYPELLRHEFLPPLLEDIADNRYDRLKLSGWRWISTSTRAHLHAGTWEDEDDSGGFTEMGFDMKELLFTRGRTDLTFFGTLGQFTSGGGVRFSTGQDTENGRWDFFYEIDFQHYRGFPRDRDDLLQHRFRAAKTYHTKSGWDLSFHAEGQVWDEDASWTAGVYLQKRL